MPSLVVIAGPNGSGKSMLTRIVRFGEVEVIDPDAIARDLSTDTTDGLEIAAAREALKRQREAIAAERSFLVETTLAGQGVIRLMNAARRAGFGVRLHYVCVGTPDQAMYRVRNRVAQGGHDVPTDDIRRRYARSLANLPSAVAQSDEAHLYDNRRSGKPYRRVAVVHAGQCWTAERCPEWANRAVEAWISLQHEMGKTVERGIGQEF